VKYLGLIVAILGSIILLTLWAFPKVITGNYAEVTITQITPEPNGHIKLGLSMVSSAGTTKVTEFYDGAKYLGGGRGSGSGPFGRPSTETEIDEFGLNPENIPSADKLEDSPWLTRLLVHVGETRRLRIGEKLYFYDFTTADTVRHYGFIEALAD